MNALQQQIQRVVTRTPLVDMHTHLYGAEFGDLLLRGIDELLTYHYLVADYLGTGEVSPDEFWALSKEEQADHVWHALFCARTPWSEATRGVLTTLQAFGLDPATPSLPTYRAYFQSLSARDAVDQVLQIAHIKEVVMTNDPFDPAEFAVWEQIQDGRVQRDPRFHAALRIDRFLLDWTSARATLGAWGYRVDAQAGDDGGDGTRDHGVLQEATRFLVDWGRRMQAVYMAVSLPPTFRYPADDVVTRLLEGAVLPACRELGIPFALMIGVRRQVNPALRLAGDASGVADLRALSELCMRHPHNRFLATLLARENQHELAVLGRKFSNLMVFGCWWFVNNPSLVTEITRMRCELLGSRFIPQHSDARVLEQVVYKWKHSRAIIADVLFEQYARVAETGWVIADDEIERDVQRLWNDNFWSFVRGDGR